MERDRRRQASAPGWAAAVLAGAVLILLTLAGLAARGLPGRETRPPPFLLDVDLLVVTRILLALLAGFGALLLILLLLPGGPPVRLPARKKSSPFKLLAGILMLFALLVVLQPFVGGSDQEAEPAGPEEAATEIDSPGFQLSGSGWGLAILGGAVLLVVWGVAVATRPPPFEEEPSQPPEPAPLTAAIDAVLADLEDSQDPRKVVIGAYAKMERALSVAGLPRRSSESPLEYLARALRRLNVNRAAITRLTSLFEEARFSEHRIHPDMAQAAVGALREIRSELSGVPS